MMDFDEIIEKIIDICRVVLMVSATVLALVFAVAEAVLLFK